MQDQLSNDDDELMGYVRTPLVPNNNYVVERPSCASKKILRITAITTIVCLSVYLLILPAAVSIAVVFEPLSVIDLKILGLPTEDEPFSQSKLGSSKLGGQSPFSKSIGNLKNNNANKHTFPTLHVVTTLKLSKSLPANAELKTSELKVSYRGMHLGTIVPTQPLDTTVKSEVTFNSSMQVETTIGFHKLGQELVQKDNITWHLTSWATVFLPIFSSTYKFPIPFVYITKDVTIKGMSGLTSMHLELFDLEDVPGPKKDVKMHIKMVLVNPSAIGVNNLGIVHFNVFFQGSFVTKLKTDGPMELKQGPNLLVSNGLFEPSSVDKVQDLITDFITGSKCTIDVVAPMSNASNVPLFSQFLGGMTLHAHITGIPSGVLVAGLMDWDPLTTIADLIKYGKLDIDSQIRLYNPFKALVTITAVKFKVYYDDIEIGSAFSNTLHVPVLSNSSVYTQKLIMTVDTKGNKTNEKAIIGCFEETLKKGYSLISLRGEFTISFGHYTFEPKYWQPANIISCTFLNRKPCDDAKPPSGPPH
jgi:hypothetical protein